MADNTTQTGTDTIATDDVTTLNGGASSGIKVQRVKVGFGDDGTHRDASAAFPLPTLPRAADLAVTATAAISTALTLTVPAAGAGLFHYVTGITIQRYAGAALTGAATPVVVTTTNLPGSLAWSVDTAAAIGTSFVARENFAGNPLRSSVANTATTIVAAIYTNAIWRFTVTYYTGT